MRLRLQIEALLLGLVVVFVISSYLVERFVVYTSFIQLERDRAGDNIQRCVEALQREQERLGTLAANWATRDEAYRHARDRDGAFSEANVTSAGFLAANLDLIAFVDAHGSPVWGNFWDRASRTLLPLVLEKETWLRPALDSVTASGLSSHAGLVPGSRGTMIVAVAQVPAGDLAGPPQGHIVMGRLLNESLRTGLVDQTRVDFVMWTEAEIPAAESQVFQDAARLGAPLILDGSLGRYLRAYRVLPGITGEPLLLFRALLPRNVTAEGRWSLRVSIAFTVAVSLALLVVVGFMFERIVSRPLHRLTVSVAEIRESGDLSGRVPELSRNEIGLLAAEFNQMLDRLQRDDTRRALLTEELRRLSERDGLTDLLNRRQFDSVLAAEWARNGRNGLPLSMAVLDVDFFKSYNDTHGHQAGDQVLIQIAGAMRSAIGRPGDVVARYGGEEFAVIMPATTLEGALKLAETIRRAVGDLHIPRGASESGGVVTASLGVATLVPEIGLPPETLFRQADHALYIAKGRGRNRVDQYGV